MFRVFGLLLVEFCDLDGIDLLKPDIYSNSLLHIAISSLNVDAVQLLLNKNVSPSPADIHASILMGAVSILQFLNEFLTNTAGKQAATSIVQEISLLQ